MVVIVSQWLNMKPTQTSNCLHDALPQPHNTAQFQQKLVQHVKSESPGKLFFSRSSSNNRDRREQIYWNLVKKKAAIAKSETFQCVVLLLLPRCHHRRPGSWNDYLLMLDLSQINLSLVLSIWVTKSISSFGKQKSQRFLPINVLGPGRFLSVKKVSNDEQSIVIMEEIMKYIHEL